MARRRRLRDLGEGLKHWRQQLGLTQAQVAEQLGWEAQQSSVSYREQRPGHPRKVEVRADELAAFEDANGLLRGTVLRWTGHVDDPQSLRELIWSHAAFAALAVAERDVLLKVAEGMVEAALERQARADELTSAAGGPPAGRGRRPSSPPRAAPGE